MKTINMNSFRTRLVMTIISVFIVPTVIISLIIDHQMKSHLKDNYLKSTTNEIIKVDTVISTFFEGIKENVRMLSDNTTVLNADKTITNYIHNTSEQTRMTPSKNGGIEAQIYREFEKYANSHPKATYVYMGTEYGGYIQWPESKIMVNWDPRTRPFYLAAFKNKGEVNISSPYYYPVDKTYGISIVKTINNQNGKLLGVMGVDVSLNGMTDLVKSMKIGENGYVILTDSKGSIIAHPLKSEYNNKSVSDLNIKGLEDVSKINDTSFETDIEGKHCIVILHTSKDTGWKYIAVVEKREVMASATRIEQLILLLSLVFLFVAIALSRIIAGMFADPIKTFVNLLKSVQTGDFTIEVPEKLLNRRDEIGTLADALSSMIENISNVLDNINLSAREVASGSGQIASSSQILAQGANDQASTIEEISASMEVLSAQTNLNASHASHANDLANDARKLAALGNEKMQDMLNSMTDINKSSVNISEIIKTVNDIAFQTNILALNAAVEAARAGEHGKGFAVVAAEVRNLAMRSASAVKETTAMIESSIVKVANGMEIANDTARSLSGIIEGVSKAANLVSEIAAASTEQATGIVQINQAIMQVSKVVQSNSAISQETAASSEEMSGQAEMLKDMVSDFKLKSLKNTTSDRQSGKAKKKTSLSFNSPGKMNYQEDQDFEKY